MHPLDNLFAEEVSIGFQTTFLPMPESGKVEFCSEAYNYQTVSNDDPKNMVLLCTSQGTAIQQQGCGSQKLFHHTVEPEDRIARHWLEARGTGHRVGMSQEESPEAAEAALASAEEAAKDAEAARWCAEAAEESEEAAAELKAAENRQAALAREASERQARAEEAQAAAAEGRATARCFGVEAMGSRCNALMTVQVPLEQKPRPRGAHGGAGANFPLPTHAIGIDLGSTSWCAAVWKNDCVDIITDELGNRTSLACVAFTEHDRLIGNAAEGHAGRDPQNVIWNPKQLLGREFVPPEELASLPYACKFEQGKPRISVNHKGKAEIYHPAEISAMVLGKVKQAVDFSMGEKKTVSCVMAVPPHFNDSQRQATKDAATMADINVLRVINEPTASAIAYGLNKGSDERHALVVDVGGTSTTVSLLCIEDGIFEVMNSEVDNHLGGHNFDRSLMQFCLSKLDSDSQKVFADNNRATMRLQKSCRSAKHMLSIAVHSTVDVEYLSEGKDFHACISRSLFERLNMEHFQRVINLCESCLLKVDMTNKAVDNVVLVGGSMRIPKLQQLVQEKFSKASVCNSIIPEDVVAYGAATQAAILANQVGSQVQDLLLLDVLPLSLGLETASGEMRPVIRRNTTVPTKKTITVTTCEDGQSSVLIKVLEGERAMAKDCNLIGQCTLEGIPIAPRATPQIDVTFDIDANGILSVSAIERVSGRHCSVTITNEKGRLSQSEVDRMVEEAERHRADDASLQTDGVAELPDPYGSASAARVSCGSLHDYWAGLSVKEPRRDCRQHCTVTVQLYHVVVGGVPSPKDVRAAIDEMESLYQACSWRGRLADDGAAFMKSELTSGDVDAILAKFGNNVVD